jgi:hypothetical protein
MLCTWEDVFQAQHVLEQKHYNANHYVMPIYCRARMNDEKGFRKTLRYIKRISSRSLKEHPELKL